ncbi:MAG TPA: hypothetical protein DHV62_02750 [Elusimicrobia bacterium]|nr:hypothetical protein [Elusimicrobiota bacterium]
MQKAGYKNIEDLAKTKIEELTALQGIGEKTAEKLIRLAKEYLAESSLLQGKEEKTDG